LADRTLPRLRPCVCPYCPPSAQPRNCRRMDSSGHPPAVLQAASGTTQESLSTFQLQPSNRSTLNEISHSVDTKATPNGRPLTRTGTAISEPAPAAPTGVTKGLSACAESPAAEKNATKTNRFNPFAMILVLPRPASIETAPCGGADEPTRQICRKWASESTARYVGPRDIGPKRLVLSVDVPTPWTALLTW